MLDLTSLAAIKKVEEFASKYTEVYYVEQLADVFGELSQNIVAIGGSPQTRQQLGKIFESVRARTLTEEKRAANDALAYFKDAENKPFFVKPSDPMANDNAQITGMKQILGPKYINYINEPQRGLEAIDPVYATM